MFLNQLTPKNNVLEYIPDFLINDDVTDATLPVIGQYLAKDMNMEDCLGFLSELNNLHIIIRGEHPDYGGKNNGTRATWFSTDKVVDVRLFFREYNKSNREGSMGSKMRLYSLGRDEDGSDEIQGIDSGFITYNSYPTAEHKFQSALSKTMLYNSLYAIGGRATVRKINESNNGKSAPTTKVREYKWLSSLKPLRCDDTDWNQYGHILHPAAIAAGVVNPTDYFDGFDGGGKKLLDGILRALLTSGSIDDFTDGLLDIRGLDLTPEDIDLIVESSNSNDANLNSAKDFTEGKAVGVNVVNLMEHILDIYPE